MTNRLDYPRRQRSGGGRDYIAPFFPDMQRTGFVPQVPRDRLLGSPIPLVILNATGATLEKGSTVVLTALNGELAITTSTTQDDIAIFGITLDRVSAGNRVRTAVFAARVKMRVAAGTTVRQYLRQSTTAGVAEGTASPTQGTFGLALEDRDATTGLAEAFFSPHALADQAFALTWARKATTESVTNSTTYQDDNDLTGITIAANAVYTFDSLVLYSHSGSGNIKLRWQNSDVSWTDSHLYFSGYRTIIGDGIPTVFTALQDDAELTAQTAAGGGVRAIVMTGSIYNFGVAVTLKLQWAQNTADGSALTLGQGTFVRLTRLI